MEVTSPLLKHLDCIPVSKARSLGQHEDFDDIFDDDYDDCKRFNGYR
jgi:hypothetical protein